MGGYCMTRELEIRQKANVYTKTIFGELDDFTDITDAYIDGAKDADKTMIEKACEWLKENLPNRMYDRNCCLDNFTEYLIEDLRKYLEE